MTVRYREFGSPDAAPVLLLHGGSSSATTWDRLAATLATAGLRTVAADLRGHGRSSRTASYPLTGYRDDILGLLDALALDRLALVGHSLGAHVASLIAQEQPARITRLVLEEPPVPGRGPAARQDRSTPRFLLTALGLFASRRGFDHAAVTSAIRQLRAPDPDWWERLGSITAPTLVVSGGPRSHLSVPRLAEVAQAIPRARLVTIAAGHRVHSRRPREFAAAVLPFLAPDA